VEQRSEASHGSNVSPNDVRLQEQQITTSDTALADRSTKAIDALDGGKKVSSRADTVSWMIQSFIDRN
jgi:hypothetical protein